MSNTKQIQAAINKAWPQLPDEFRAWQLWGKVNKLLPHLDVYADTVMHTLRNMNQDSDYKLYRCLNRQESLYQKIQP